MKRLLNKSLTLFSIFMLLFLAFPTSFVSANQQSNNVNTYKSVDQKYDVSIDNVTISSIEFVNNDTKTADNFGLKGKIINTGFTKANLEIDAKYYNAQYELIASSKYNQDIPTNKSVEYLQMSDIAIIKNGYNVYDIAYYDIDLSVSDVNNEFVIPSELDRFDSFDYVIDYYDIDIVVGENNVLKVTETIDVHFNWSSHGIYRSIPLVNEVVRSDGSSVKARTGISNVKVSGEYETYRENSNFVIKIGDPDVLVTGDKKYTISYDYNLGEDKNENFDELYYNIIGSDWETVIGRVDFSITMPKSFDSSLLGFSHGLYGSSNSDNVKYIVEGNTIKGSYYELLEPNEALTIRLELEDGYFVGAGFSTSVWVYVAGVILIIFVIIAIVLWIKYGKDAPVIEVVEFYPPEGMNSLELAYCYNGDSSTKDVLSLIIYLASKGYFRVQEVEGNEFKFIKLKDYDGDNPIEEKFIKGLFSGKSKPKESVLNDLISKGVIKPTDNLDNIRVVNKGDLEYKFYKTIESVLEMQNTKSNHDKIFNKKTFFNTYLTPILSFLSILLGSLVALHISYNPLFPAIITSIFLTLGIYLIICSITGNGNVQVIVNGNKKSLKDSIGVRIATLFIGFFATLMPLVLIWVMIMYDNQSILILLLSVAASIVITIFGIFMPKRNKYGNEILGKIRGFRKFLLTAEKNQLETLVEQDPTYFYNILPYTYVLNISNKWIKKFESIAIAQPDWYISTTAFDIIFFDHIMSSSMVSSMASIPVSKSSSGGFSGGSSGGGFSGGGFGGGGGGSW